jgi:hypothetical protein
VPKNEREWWASREIEKLERELAAAKAECDLNRTRLASIFWSGAMDKFTGGDVQKWAADYTAELTAAKAECERLKDEILAIGAKPMFYQPQSYAATRANEIQQERQLNELARLRAEVERWQTVAAQMSDEREHNANEAGRLRAEVEAARLRGDVLQAEVDRWTKWHSDQPWLAEIYDYQKQLARAEADAARWSLLARCNADAGNRTEDERFNLAQEVKQLRAENAQLKLPR